MGRPSALLLVAEVAGAVERLGALLTHRCRGRSVCWVRPDELTVASVLESDHRPIQSGWWKSNERMRRTSSGSRDTFSSLFPIEHRQWARRLLLREKEWLLSESQSPDVTYLRTAIVAGMYAPSVGYDACLLSIPVRGVGIEPTLSGSQGRRITAFLPPVS